MQQTTCNPYLASRVAVSVCLAPRQLYGKQSEQPLLHDLLSYRCSCLEARLLLCSQLNQPVSWHLLNSTKVFLTKTDPLIPNNQVAMNVTTHAPGGGIANTGFWGVPLNGGWIYHFSVYLKGDEYANNSKVPPPPFRLTSLTWCTV